MKKIYYLQIREKCAFCFYQAILLAVYVPSLEHQLGHRHVVFLLVLPHGYDLACYTRGKCKKWLKVVHYFE